DPAHRLSATPRARPTRVERRCGARPPPDGRRSDDRADGFPRIPRRRSRELAWPSGGRQRGTPLNAPLNGEKLPRPANVNDMKKRWSDGTAKKVPAPKLNVWYSNDSPQHWAL